MKPIDVKKKLSASIDGVANNFQNYCVNEKSDFKRSRKLPYKRMMQGIIGMGGAVLQMRYLRCQRIRPNPHPHLHLCSKE